MIEGDEDNNPDNHVRINYLKPNTRYQVRVKATGPGGNSQWLIEQFRTKSEDFEVFLLIAVDL